MKKLFAILALLCLLMAAPVMAASNYVNSNFDDYSDQMQGGLQLYIDNPAFEYDDVVSDSDSFNLNNQVPEHFSMVIDSLETFDAAQHIGASADIIAGQVSFQMQDNGASGGIHSCQHTDWNDQITSINSTFIREGQSQEWLSTQVIDTNFGQVQMQQYGIQNGSNVIINVIGGASSTHPEMPIQYGN